MRIQPKPQIVERRNNVKRVTVEMSVLSSMHYMKQLKGETKKKTDKEQNKCNKKLKSGYK